MYSTLLVSHFEISGIYVILQKLNIWLNLVIFEVFIFEKPLIESKDKHPQNIQDRSVILLIPFNFISNSFLFTSSHSLFK